MATQSGIVSVPTLQVQPAEADMTRRSWLKSLGAALGLGLLAGPAMAATQRRPNSVSSLEPFIGEIMLFAGNFAVRGYALCDGQILSIAQNTALFSILGTTYGGNGQTTFALPDLRGRSPMHFGQGPGLSSRSLGEVAGHESNSLNINQMPAHNHGLNVSTVAANAISPAGKILAEVNGSLEDGSGVTMNAFTNTSSNAVAAPASIGLAGGSQPFDNMAPYLALNYQIALEGVFPSRN
jgi:microcystin-dependent protein